MSEVFTSSGQLKEAFGIADHPEEYENLTLYTGEEVGFSVLRKYPPTGRYKPPVTRNGTPDTVALIGILYGPSREGVGLPDRVPISLRVSVHSLYVASHFDYDFSDPQCPTEESVIASKKTPRPVDRETLDQYFFDHSTECFVDSAGNPTSGMDIINSLYEDHLATVGTFKGLRFRWKLGSKDKAARLCESAERFLKWIIWKVCGYTVGDSLGAVVAEQVMSLHKSDKHTPKNIYAPKDMKPVDAESRQFLGYQAPERVIITFCVLVLFVFILLRPAVARLPWLKIIANSNYLLLVTSILMLAILKWSLPRVLLRLLNWFIRMEWKIRGLRPKFK